MPKAKATPEVAEEQPKEVKPSKTEFSVYQGEELIRTYSLEIHGEDAEKLAHEFAANHGGEVR
jgi:hypothetical protein